MKNSMGMCLVEHGTLKCRKDGKPGDKLWGLKEGVTQTNASSVPCAIVLLPRRQMQMIWCHYTLLSLQPDVKQASRYLPNPTGPRWRFYKALQARSDLSKDEGHDWLALSAMSQEEGQEGTPSHSIFSSFYATHCHFSDYENTKLQIAILISHIFLYTE